MLTSAILLLAVAATGLAQSSASSYKVYLTSMVDKTYVIVPKAAKNGSTIVVKPEQQWVIAAGNTTIQLANSTLCLDGGAKSNWKDMASVYIQDCVAGSVSQIWTVKADGRIALAASSPLTEECLDLQYMRATPNNPVGLYSCAGLNNAGAADKGINWPPANVTS
ncbi:hypothetical protein LSUE1_G000287 [Lachnellula suecica]|uniref:Ricin B lectin domain-containing protein n=1 Tax=Lachnellula suecica TaxID=602035 RepID=A0A8T9CME4_9HELO|nr:hypothetical protein LSUE1_G000287 [Lachnellula suecica]